MPYLPENRSSERDAYTAAKQRCTNPNNPNFEHYGARSVQFLYPSFAAFIADLGPCPEGHTLHRIDNDGNYEAGNCQWTTQQDQVGKRRAYGMHGYKGVAKRPSGRYFTQVTVDGKQINLPTVDTILEAARQYDGYVIGHGLDRTLNFPEVE
jgi:hypothetical protein